MKLESIISGMGFFTHRRSDLSLGSISEKSRNPLIPLRKRAMKKRRSGWREGEARSTINYRAWTPLFWQNHAETGDDLSSLATRLIAENGGWEHPARTEKPDTAEWFAKEERGKFGVLENSDKAENCSCRTPPANNGRWMLAYLCYWYPYPPLF